MKISEYISMISIALLVVSAIAMHIISIKPTPEAMYQYGYKHAITAFSCSSALILARMLVFIPKLKPVALNIINGGSVLVVLYILWALTTAFFTFSIG